uniref:Choline/carnitine acyltransferase domain-containing protein n=1 Tax=Geospiza parvula TaxID=87175 RepID=A0A8U8BWJ6_GEOPR
MFCGRRPGLRSLQGALPALPLPPLSDTVRQAVESLQSLGPGGVGEGLPPLARSFLGGPGPQIQRWLRLRGWALPCYLSELWEEQLHLGARGPLPSTGSYYLMDVLGPPPSRVPAARAANVAFAFLSFRSLVRAGSLPPVLFRGSLPTCSAQYERLFDTTRIPGEHRDRLLRSGGGSGALAALGGRLFRVPPWGGGAPEPPRAPGTIPESSGTAAGAGGSPPRGREPRGADGRGQVPLGPGPGPAGGRGGSQLCSPAAPRGRPVRHRLRPLPGQRGAPKNGKPPKTGTPPAKRDPEERDPPRDGDLDNEAKALLLGPPHNRWFDKSLTLVVFPSGRVGLNVEHSWGDPPVAGHLWEFALALDRSLGYDESGSCIGESQGRAPEPPQELHWDLPPQVSGVLPQAREQFQAMAEGLQLHVVSVEAPPGTSGTPESSQELLALALELALVRERSPALTYEPIPTRLFLEGSKTHLRPHKSN